MHLFKVWERIGGGLLQYMGRPKQLNGMRHGILSKTYVVTALSHGFV
jgi:hypothetical protein